MLCGIPQVQFSSEPKDSKGTFLRYYFYATHLWPVQWMYVYLEPECQSLTLHCLIPPCETMLASTRTKDSTVGDINTGGLTCRKIALKPYEILLPELS